MAISIIFVIVAWLILEFILYCVHCWQYGPGHATRAQEDRLLISILGMAFGMLIGVLVYLKLTYF